MATHAENGINHCLASQISLLTDKPSELVLGVILERPNSMREVEPNNLH